MDLLFILSITLIAALYASVGHGGASGYLAVMVIFGLSPVIIRPSALMLNLFVSAMAFYAYYRNGHFRFRLLWPFVITSLPMAFIGGSVSVNATVYKIILGLFLLFAIFRLLYRPGQAKNEKRPLQLPLALAFGAILGFLSGLIGIGGGIILSPVLLLLRVGNIKEVAAVSAAFIWINSASALSAFMLKGYTFSEDIPFMIIAAIAGGFVGSGLGSYRIPELALRYTLCGVLTLASFKLIMV